MIEPRRILHIVHTLNRGGMESRIMDLYRNLDHDRFQYDFYVESGKTGMYDEKVRSLGGKVYYSQGINKHNIPDFKAFRLFLANHSEYKIVYAYNQWAGFYLKQAKKCDVPFRIANARTSIQTKSLKNHIKNIAKLNVNKYATHRFAVSKRAGDWLFGSKTKDVRIWPNAIDTRRFAFSEDIKKRVRKQIGLGDELTIIHVGNLRFEKNHPYLLRVFAEIRRQRPDAVLILIGGGDVENLAAEMNVLGIYDSVKHLGVRDDIEKLLHVGDIFIFPSLYEGFPGAVLEAEASGLKCVISDSITDEVMLTNHIEMMSLLDKPENWAKKALAMSDVKRESAWKEIKEAGYDVSDLTLHTQEFYESIEL